MEMTSIKIDLDVFKAIQQELKSFNETPNDVLRRKFNLGESCQPADTPIPRTNGDMLIQGAVLKAGLQLKKNFKGQIYEAVVRDGRIYVDGKPYNSPSSAAMAITNSAVNGWQWWQYQDQNNRWVPIDKLRNH